MISRLYGTIVEIAGHILTLDVHGVGYEVFCSQASLEGASCGDERTFLIHTDVKEDHIKLYGFKDKTEKEVFLLLTAVKGVGAKSASDIVSKIDRYDLLRAIGKGDVTRLQRVKGIGKKTAERIIVELKDRVVDYVHTVRPLSESVEVCSTDRPQDDALAALEALGFSRKDAEAAIAQLALEKDLTPLDPGEIVREALQYV
ncbi:MAG: Holliday junction branch migration protein RuvA [Bdellovibrionales bacterium]|nr:Holliday junction branch migration protein RuvA [Bdellovibrionales bacterium]